MKNIISLIDTNVIINFMIKEMIFIRMHVLKL